MNVEGQASAVKARPERARRARGRSPSAKMVETHAAVWEAVRTLTEKVPAVTVREVAVATGHDPRVVQRHLELVALHGEGLFLDKDRSVFALAGPMREAVRAVLARDEGLAMSYDAEAEELFRHEARRRERLRGR